MDFFQFVDPFPAIWITCTDFKYYGNVLQLQGIHFVIVYCEGWGFLIHNIMELEACIKYSGILIYYFPNLGFLLNVQSHCHPEKH
jgi:hypothetical protein